MAIYINKKSGERYNGGSITVKTRNGIFSGVPSVEQLTKWGYEEYVPPVVEENEEETTEEVPVEEVEEDSGTREE